MKHPILISATAGLLVTSSLAFAAPPAGTPARGPMGPPATLPAEPSTSLPTRSPMVSGRDFGTATRDAARVNSQGSVNASATAKARANANSAVTASATSSPSKMRLASSLRVGTTIKASKGGAYGTVAQVIRSSSGRITTVLVRTPQGLRKVPIGTLSMSGGVITTSYGGMTRR